MSTIHIESIPLILEIKEGLELSYAKTKAKKHATVYEPTLAALDAKEKRITELLTHIYNTLPCTPAEQN